MKPTKKEAILRLSTVVFLVLTSCLVGFDRQKKVLFYSVTKTATFRDMKALVHLVCITSAVAGYNVLQLFRCLVSSASPEKLTPGSYLFLAWASFLLDLAALYITFATNSAAVQACVFAVTGESSFQWMKLCNRYHRFCTQIGSALLSGYAACVLMVLISSVSTFNLFRLYSPKHFLVLKSKVLM